MITVNIILSIFLILIVIFAFGLTQFGDHKSGMILSPAIISFVIGSIIILESCNVNIVRWIIGLIKVIINYV